MMRSNEREVLRFVWEEGRLSRSELRDRTGMTGNGVGLIADELVRRGMLRECPPEPGAGAGRPRVPLEIDPTTLHILGVAIGPGRVEMTRLGLGGLPVSKTQIREVKSSQHLVDAAANLLRAGLSKQVIGVGVSVTGFVDPIDRAILFSSSQPGAGRVSLAPAVAAAGTVPIVLENDMHALAARWLLGEGKESARQDVLLVSVAEGRLGAAMLINGRPNRGCVTGGNELGHNRFFVETERCFCGHVGCLERIVTTDFLIRRDAALSPRRRRDVREDAVPAASSTLADRMTRYAMDRAADEAIEDVIRYLSCGLANMINFVRPHRVLLINEIGEQTPLAFNAALRRGVREWLLPELVDRVQFEIASEPAVGSAESAAWLAIADFVHGGWSQASDRKPETTVTRSGRSAERVSLTPQVG
jgi:predicted NBD/HSP70 family sugar kinase